MITDSGQDFGTEPKSHAEQAGDHLGEWMAAKSVLDVAIDLLEYQMRWFDHWLRENDTA